MSFSLLALSPETFPAETFRIPAERGTLRVGRVPGSDLCVPHTSVSSMHAMIESDGGEGVVVVDCGSTNGTFVNGARVDRCRLTDGDVLRFATVEFRVRQEAAAGERSAPFPPSAPSPPTANGTGPVLVVEAPEPETGVERAELQRREMEISRLGVEAHAREGRIRQLEGELRDAAQRESGFAEALQTERWHRETEVSRLETEAHAREGRIRQLEGELRDAAQRESGFAEALQTERWHRETEVSRLETEAQAREGRIQQLESELQDTAQRESGLAEALQTERWHRETEVSRLEAEAQTREGRIQQLEVELQEAAQREGGLAETLQAERSHREAEVSRLEAEVEAREERIRQFEREIEDGAQREQRLHGSLSEARREVIDREGGIANLRYEIGTLEGKLRQTEEQRARLQGICDDYATAHEESKARTAAMEAELESAREARAAADHRVEEWTERLGGLGRRLLSDWKSWFEPGDVEFSPDAGLDGTFVRVEEVASRVRSELDRIEPVWHQHGDQVLAELSRRCEERRGDLAAIEGEITLRREDLAKIEGDLVQFREWMDVEVRRAQGLSRKGIEVEIPERFETMVIARDREQEIYRVLVEQIETLDRCIGGCGSSRKLTGMRQEIEDSRRQIAATLEAGGVRAFEVGKGVFLTPSHRREVQVLSRKGWGVKQYVPHPFQPGEVVQVVRSGYRVGEGDSAAILRKVEVLIRGVEG